MSAFVRFVLITFATLFLCSFNNGCYGQNSHITGVYVKYSADIDDSATEEFQKELLLKYPTLSYRQPFLNSTSPYLREVVLFSMNSQINYNELLVDLEGEGIIEYFEIEDVKANEPSSISKSVDQQENHVVTVAACDDPIIPNDPGSFNDDPDLIHLRTMQLPCAWTLSQGSDDIVIGVIDNYFFENHPDLSNRYVAIHDLPQGGPTFGGLGHGTASAGAAAAITDNGLCVSGGAYNAKVDAYCVISGSNSIPILEQAMKAALAGRPIINLSVDNSSWSNINNSLIARACFQEIIDMGSVVTYAVNGDNAIGFGDLDGMLITGMAWKDGWFRTYNSGQPDRNIDMVVPCRDIVRLEPTDCGRDEGNTSIGAPYLAGVVALMLDVNPCLTPFEVEKILKESADPIRNPQHTFGEIRGGGNLNAFRAVQMAESYVNEDNLIVENGEYVDITNETKAYNRIEVMPGGRLDINNSRIIIDGNKYGDSNDGRIVVHRGAKLIARASHFNKPVAAYCEEVAPWSGFRIHGNIDREQPDMFQEFEGTLLLNVNTTTDVDDSGVLMLLDGTTIMNAVNAVATTVPGMPYQDQVDRWGGLVIAMNSKFINNFRGAEFTQYPRKFSGNLFKNKSVFKQCLFETEDLEDRRSLGATIWGTEGVTFEGCQFLNQGRESIVAVDGNFVAITGNKFRNDRNVSQRRRAIMLLNTYPFVSNFPTTIGRLSDGDLQNEFITFSRNDQFIYAATITANEQLGLRISNNLFEHSAGDGLGSGIITIDGPSNFRIVGNKSTDGRFLRVKNTSLNTIANGNEVSCNTIFNGSDPIVVRGDNSSAILSGNVFERDDDSENTSISLLNIGGDPGDFNFIAGKVRGNQGSTTRPVNNVFNTTPQSLDIFVEQDATPFRYYFTGAENDQSNSLFPNGVSNYEKLNTSFDYDRCEELDGLGGGEIYSDSSTVNNNQPYTENEIAQNIEYFSQFSSISADQKLERDNLILTYLASKRDARSISDVEELLSKYQDYDTKKLLFGIKMNKGALSQADDVLQSIGPHFEAEEFVEIQKVNLDYIQSSTGYNLSLGDSIMLDDIARSPSPNRGYARGLMYLLHDLRYYDDEETHKENGTKQVESKSTPIAEELLIVYPNPMLSSELVLSGDLVRSGGTVVIYDSAGNIVLKETVNKGASGVYKLNLALHHGLFFVHLRHGDKTQSAKLIVR